MVVEVVVMVSMKLITRPESLLTDRDKDFSRDRDCTGTRINIKWLCIYDIIDNTVHIFFI